MAGLVIASFFTKAARFSLNRSRVLLGWLGVLGDLVTAILAQAINFSNVMFLIS